MDKPNFGLLRRQASAPRAPRALVRMQRYGGRAVLTTPKSEKVRTITVPALVAVEVRRHLGDHVGEGILFRGLRGAEMLRRDQFYSSAWRPALRAACSLPGTRYGRVMRRRMQGS